MKKIKINIELVDASIPLLIGSNSMEKGEAVIDFKNKSAVFFGEQVPMFKVGSGHMCIDVFSQFVETHINDLEERYDTVLQVLVASEKIDLKTLKSYITISVIQHRIVC